MDAVEQGVAIRDKFVAECRSEWAFRGLEYMPLDYMEIHACMMCGLDTSECIGVGLDVYSGVSFNAALECLSI